MQNRLTQFILAGVLALLANVAGATTVPVGVQNNISDSTVASWGFSECWNSTYGTTGTSISSILSGCSGSHLMMAGRAVGSSTWDVLAAADFASVTTNTGNGNTTTSANDVEWYFSESYSWGFAKGGDTVSRSSCDTGSANAAQRLCWHTGGGDVQGGWRVGAQTSLNSNNNWERSLFVANVSVPEPGQLVLIMLGLIGLLGVSKGRTKA